MELSINKRGGKQSLVPRRVSTNRTANRISRLHKNNLKHSFIFSHIESFDKEERTSNLVLAFFLLHRDVGKIKFKNEIFYCINLQ